MNISKYLNLFLKNTPRLLSSALLTFFIFLVFFWFCTKNYPDFYKFSTARHLYAILSIEFIFFLMSNIFKNKKIYIFIHSVFIFFLVNYYGTVIVGLEFWNDVINKELFVSYLTQINKLVEVVDLSKLSLFICLSLLFILVFVCKYYSFMYGLKKYGALNVNVKCITYCILCSLCISAHAVFILFSPELSNDSSEQDRALTNSEIVERESEKEKNIDAQEDAERVKYFSLKQVSNNTNIIIITGDSLRPDHMSLYGYPRNTTPRLEKFVRDNEGIHLNTMRSVCGHTSCGMQGLISSKYVDFFSKNPVDLYEVLRSIGYKTSLFLGGDFVHFYNSNTIFRNADFYFDGNEARKTNSYINGDEWIISKSAQIKEENQPQLLQFHLMTTHFLGDVSIKNKAFFPEKRCSRLDFSYSIDVCFNKYDNAVIQFDFNVNKILENLEKNNLLKKSIVIISADHGEYLGEKGLFSHAQSFYEPVMKVPFIVILPEYLREGTRDAFEKAKKCAMPTSIADIAPTILSLINVASPKSWHGLSILGNCLENRRVKYNQSEYSVEIFREDEWLFKEVKDTKTGEMFRFNLTQDPNENNKILVTSP